MTTFIRVLVILGSIIVALGVFTGLSFLIVTSQTVRQQKRLAASIARESFTPEELREDVAWFANALVAMHPATIPEFPLKDISGSLETFRQSLDRPLSRLEFYRGFASIACSLGDEHTSATLPLDEIERFQKSGGTFFPLTVIWIDDRLFVKTAPERTVIQPGTQIISVQGIRSDALRDELMTRFSGTRDGQKLDYLGANFAAALYAGLGMNGPFELVLRGPGASSDVTVLVPGSGSPSARQENFSYRLVDGTTAVMTFRSFQDPEHTYTAFLQSMFDEIASRKIQNLIIDLRGNKGGMTFMGDRLISYMTDAPSVQFRRMETLVSAEARKRFISEVPAAVRWIPMQYFHPSLSPLWKARIGQVSTVDFQPVKSAALTPGFRGRLYVIIGPGSMSSSTLFASCARSFLKATLVGEPTGGMDTMYGNMAEYRLPNTGLEVELPSSVLYGNTFGPVVPNHAVMQAATDLASGKDSALEACLSLIAARK
jgi:hypothetical protein